MLHATEFLTGCHERGFRFISGTPCSYLKPLINAAIDDGRFVFRDAVNEGDAVAMGAGAVLGGAQAMVMFQNSGLGNAVNALTSLCRPFRVPVLLIVTHRGEPGGEQDEPQHEQMGRITTGLLDTMEIPWARFPAATADVAGVLDRAVAEMREHGRPFALVMSKDAVAPHPLATRAAPGATGERTLHFTERWSRGMAERMTRTEALQLVRATRRPGEALVATTGYTGRELYALGDDPWNLYVVGSMGSASALGLGLALQQPGRPVTVIDGDGALLMRMGNLATLGAYAPPTLRHVVLDNEAHDSTGGQSTVSGGVSFGALAQACGYRRVVAIDDPGELASLLRAPQGETESPGARETGPEFFHVRIKPGAPEKLPRPRVTPAEVFRRLQGWLQPQPPPGNGVPGLPG